jgi:hypothetical protein
LYGNWYSIEASDSAYSLWMTSLYGNTEEMKNPGCLFMDLTAGPEEKTLNIQVFHKEKSVKVQGALLGDAFHPGTSKWVMSWPNGGNEYNF